MTERDLIKAVADHDQQTQELISHIYDLSREEILAIAKDTGMVLKLVKWALVELGVKAMERKNNDLQDQ